MWRVLACGVAIACAACAEPLPCAPRDGGCGWPAPTPSRDLGPRDSGWYVPPRPDLGPWPAPRDGGPDEGPWACDFAYRDGGACTTGARCEYAHCGCPLFQFCDFSPFYTGAVVRMCPGTEIAPVPELPDRCHVAFTPTAIRAVCDLAAASDDPSRAGLDGCPPCTKCVTGPVRSGSGELGLGCAKRCTRAVGTSGGCGVGERCDEATGTCLLRGCSSDAECHVYEQRGGPYGTYERCYDPREATCDLATARCTHPGAPLARAGDPCVSHSDCEDDGECLDELDGGMPGGYCTQRDCDLDGCASPPDACVLVAGAHLCVGPCTLGAEGVALSMGPDAHGLGCRRGYACTPDDGAAPGSTGHCWPGRYTDVTTDNVGHACTADANCWSPYGAGGCLAETGACSVLDCAAFPDVLQVCGTRAECETLADGRSACLLPCATADDCVRGHAPDGSACVDASLLAPGATGRVCALGCAEDADCPAPLLCRGDTATTLGRCS